MDQFVRRDADFCRNGVEHAARIPGPEAGGQKGIAARPQGKHSTLNIQHRIAEVKRSFHWMFEVES